MHRSIGDNKVSEKFSVDTILDSQKVYRKRRRDEEMDDDSHREDVIGLQTKKPNLKFGIDAILNDNSEEQHSPPVITDSSSLKSSHCQTSGPLQSEHCFGRNPSTVCYESQCFATAMNTMNKPLASGYQLYYYPYASVNPIAINNIGEGYGLAYNPSYGYTGYTTFNQSSVKSGDQCSSQSAKSKKAKWNRAVFTNLQRKGLEKRFSFQKYITKPDRRKLAESLNLSDSQVKVWFQNRRMKWRHSKEYREELSKTASNKEQQLISNFPVNKSDESTQNAN